MAQIRVLVIDDDSFTRSAITSAIDGDNIKVVSSVGSSAEAIQAFEAQKPDCVLVDLDLGKGPTGADLVKAFRMRNPQVGIVMLTSYSDPRLLRNNLPTLPAGTEYLVKSSVNEISVVISALAQSIENARPDNSRFKRPQHDIPRDLQFLTDIQVETLRMVSQGFTNNEIAKQRSVSEKAVEQTITKIARALDIPVATNQNQRVHIARVYFRLTGQGNL